MLEKAGLKWHFCTLVHYKYKFTNAICQYLE